MHRALVAGPLLTLALLSPSFARADEDAPAAPATTAAQSDVPTDPSGQPVPPTGAPADPTTSPIPVQGENAAGRSTTLEPKAAEPAPPKIQFAADPIADGGIIIAAGAFAGLLELINSTGEIRPQQIAPNFDRSQLLWIDRVAVYQTPDGSAKGRSNILLFSAVGFAVLDPILTGFREQHIQAALVDGIIYAEALSVTLGVTNLAKLAVRRPRPQAYIDAEAHKGDPNYDNADTDSALSFFSGHASITATIAATSTYLAFARAPNLWRPLITLGVGTAVTAYTSYERVHGAAHFPTDVIAGALAGAGIGVIVTHLHRSEDVKQRRIWVGFAPERDSGGAVQLGGLF